MEKRPRAPWGLLGMLGLVVLAEGLLELRDRDFLTLWCADRREAGRIVRRETPSCPILCLGDSQVKTGVLPQVLQTMTGRRAYNLALHGGQAPSTYLILRRALNSGAKPVAVVVDFEPLLLRVDPQANIRAWSEPATCGEAYQLSRVLHDAEFVGSVLVARCLPSAGARHEIRAAFRAALGGVGIAYRDNIPAFRRNWSVNQGAQVMPSGVFYKPKLIDDPEFIESAAFHPANVVYLDRFLRLAANHGIRVFWLLPPVHPEAQALRDRSGFDQRQLRAMRRRQARFPNLTMLDARHSHYIARAFFDPAHLRSLLRAFERNDPGRPISGVCGSLCSIALILL